MFDLLEYYYLLYFSLVDDHSATRPEEVPLLCSPQLSGPVRDEGASANPRIPGRESRVWEVLALLALPIRH